MTTQEIATAPPVEEGFDLNQLFAFLWQNKFRIAITTALLLVGAFYHVSGLPKLYSANSTLLLGSEGNKYGMNSTLGNVESGKGNNIDTYLEFIKSRHFAVSVIEKLELMRYKEFTPLPGSPFASDREEFATQVYLKNLNLGRLGETNLVKVTFTSKEPEVAAEVANGVGPIFFDFILDQNRTRADSASVWLEDQLEIQRIKLLTAEQALQDFQEENQLIDFTSQIELARTEISALLTEKHATDKQLSQSTATLSRVTAAGESIEQLLQVPRIIQNPIVTDIRSSINNQEQILKEVSQRYKYKHPKYIAAAALLEQLKADQEEIVEKLIASIRLEHETLVERKEAIELQIASAKSQHSDLGRHELRLSKLERDVESHQKMYELFLSRVQETQILKDMGNQEDFAVVDFAPVPRFPSQPRVALLLAISAVVSLIFSSAFWLVIHFISDKQNRIRKIIAQQGIPILTEVPKLNKPLSVDSEFGEGIKTEKQYQFTESIRSLRTAVMVRNEENENRIIAVTSVKPGDGKSSIAISLAQSFSRLEKALLLDVDLRSPSIGKAFGLNKKYPGVTDFISRKARFSDCLHHSPKGSLVVMPSGAIPQDPIVYLSKPRFANFIKKLSIFYERLIVEAPPVNSFSDALVVSRYVDGVIIVCDIESSDSIDIIEAIQRLRDAGAPIIGVVLNRAKNIKIKDPRRSRLRRLLKMA